MKFPRFFRKRNNPQRIFENIDLDAIGNTTTFAEPKFTKVKLRKTNLRYLDYLAAVKQQWYFTRFSHITDVACAETLAYKIFIGISDIHASPRAELTKDNLKQFLDGESKITFNKEYNKAYEGLDVIRLIFLRALKGEFRKELALPANRATLNPAGGMALKPFMLAADIACAVDWITGNSGSINNNQQQNVSADLRALMHDIIGNQRDLFDVTTINRIDGVTGDKDFIDRPAYNVSSEAAYGGIVIGRFMQKDVIKKARLMKQNVASNPAFWLDLACLMMVGHIRAQPYPDGNHRVACTLYACILLQKGRPFIAPNYKWMHQLRMDPFSDAVLNNGSW
jgi:hypothetical protein